MRATYGDGSRELWPRRYYKITQCTNESDAGSVYRVVRCGFPDSLSAGATRVLCFLEFVCCAAHMHSPGVGF